MSTLNWKPTFAQACQYWESNRNDVESCTEELTYLRGLNDPDADEEIREVEQKLKRAKAAVRRYEQYLNEHCPNRFRKFQESGISAYSLEC